LDQSGFLAHRKSLLQEHRKSPVRRSNKSLFSSSASEAAILGAFIYYFIMSEQHSSHKTPKLDNDNYYAWSYRMEMKLRKLGVWNIVNGTESRPVGSDNHKVVKAWQTRVDLALSEIIGEVSDSQLVHTRVSRDPADIWERLQATHVSQGLGSIIAIWQRFFTLKKADDTSVQAHASVIRELADRLTGLGDGPSETLMVSVLMLSLPKSYGTLIISLDTHDNRTNFDFVVQRCMNEEARQASTAQPGQPNSAFHAQTKRDKADVTCYKCGKKGHYRNECPDLKGEEKKESKDGEKESAASAEDILASW
jgi:gag-polypeptide of LTR copia-type/Zinc knuckle